jgi:hypothetical protein
MQKMCSRARWHSLDVHGGVGGDDDIVIAEIAHLAAAIVAEADGDDVYSRDLVEALKMLELPEVEMPRKTSPGWSRAST